MDSVASVPLRRGIEQGATDLVQIPQPGIVSSEENTLREGTDIFNASRDIVGAPVLTHLLERAEKERQTRLSEVRTILGSLLRKKEVFDPKRNPAKADFYLLGGSLDYPSDFVGPEPYQIKGEEEWREYSNRVRAIEERWTKKVRDELAGDSAYF